MRQGTDIFTIFFAEYPTWLLSICYLFTPMKVKSYLPPWLIHFPLRLSLGIIWGSILQSSLRSLGNRWRSSTHFMWAAAVIHHQCRSGSSQTFQCSSKGKFCIIMMKYFKYMKAPETHTNEGDNIGKAINQ